jgi:hypothetical protein
MYLHRNGLTVPPDGGINRNDKKPIRPDRLPEQGARTTGRLLRAGDTGVTRNQSLTHRSADPLVVSGRLKNAKTS